eukprot:825746-Rhodomonas_salina.1
MTRAACTLHRRNSYPGMLRVPGTGKRLEKQATRDWVDKFFALTLGWRRVSSRRPGPTLRRLHHLVARIENINAFPRVADLHLLR